MEHPLFLFCFFTLQNGTRYKAKVCIRAAERLAPKDNPELQHAQDTTTVCRYDQVAYYGVQ